MFDPECAICANIANTISNLEQLCNHIDICSSGKRPVEEFGIRKVYVKNTILPELHKLKKFHEFYHATGRSLSQAGNDVESSSKPNVRRRYRAN